MGCGKNLAPTEEGVHETVYSAVDEQTKSVVIACDDCRSALPGSWAKSNFSLTEEGDHLHLEQLEDEVELAVNVAQAVVGDEFKQASSEVVSEAPPPVVPGVKKVKVERKPVGMRCLIGEAIDKAKAGFKKTFIILPTDLQLMVGKEEVKEGDKIRDVPVYRDPKLVAADTQFLRVGSVSSLERGLISIVRFKGGQVRRDTVQKMTLNNENERRFMLSMIGEDH